MALKTSHRSDIPMFRALDILRDVNERVAGGDNIMRLEAGQPCVGAPPQALEYAKQILTNDGRQGYTDAMGMSLLRDRIALYYRDHYNTDLDYTRIAVSVGSSSGLLMSFLSAFDVGDRVALTTPTYPAYHNILTALGLQIIEIETTPETNYQPTAELLEGYGEEFDGLIICSPSNPTGTMIPAAELERICRWCDKNEVRLISDEAYHGITYEEPAETVLKYTNNAIVLNTFSKYFAMTGWRLGWMVLPEDLTDRVKRLMENFFVSPPTLSQHVAYKIFDHMDVLDGYVARYKQNWDILKVQLPEAGFDKLSEATGAFYVYADVHHLTNNSEEYCRRMLEEAKVSTTPGVDFDVTRGHGTIRMCYAGETEEIEEACRRLKQWQG